MIKLIITTIALFILIASPALASDPITFGTYCEGHHYQLTFTGGSIGIVDFVNDGALMAQKLYLGRTDAGGQVIIEIPQVATLWYYAGLLRDVKNDVVFELESGGEK